MSYLLDQYPPRRVRNKDNRPRSAAQRGAGAGKLDQQLLSVGKDIALLAERLPVGDQRVVAPGEDPGVRTRRREQIQRPVGVGFGRGGALRRGRGELGELEAGRRLGGGLSEKAL